MRLASALPEAIAESRPVQILERSIEQGRLGHALLLHGPDILALEQTAKAVAGVLLNRPESPEKHPDYFVAGPVGRSRQIKIDLIRDLVRNIQHTSNQGGRKVAIVHEADRFNQSSANAFLKALEEPPADATILLLTSRPYDLLDTIRSRCLSFRINAQPEPVDNVAWRGWLEDYTAWMEQARDGDQRDAAIRADTVMRMYGLLERFVVILDEVSSVAWKAKRETLPQGLEKDVREALEAGAKRGIRDRLFAEISTATRAFAIGGGRLDASAMAFGNVTRELERLHRLFVYNLREEVALENFMLASLRFWAR